MALLAVGFACAPLILSAFLAPKKPGEIKEVKPIPRDLLWLVLLEAEKNEQL